MGRYDWVKIAPSTFLKAQFKFKDENPEYGEFALYFSGLSKNGDAALFVGGDTAKMAQKSPQIVISAMLGEGRAVFAGTMGWEGADQFCIMVNFIAQPPVTFDDRVTCVGGDEVKYTNEFPESGMVLVRG